MNEDILEIMNKNNLYYPNLKGFIYLEYILKNYKLSQNIESIYEKTAKNFGVTKTAIERDVRYLIKMNNCISSKKMICKLLLEKERKNENGI